MIVERIELNKLRQKDNLAMLSGLQVGDSIFCDEEKKAQSMRVLSYYLLKSRNLPWKFIFRKMDRGWRVIRIS